MAEITVSMIGSNLTPAEENWKVEQISSRTRVNTWISGKIGTFCFVRDNEDSIASAGYARYVDRNSMQESLSLILKCFTESSIGELKKNLIGQYVLVINKNDKIYMFTDFFGARSIFYCDDGSIISTSFSTIERMLKINSDDLDYYKVLEFLAMRHVMYPTWIGASTMNKRIKWLLPNEYLVIDISKSKFRKGSISYKIDNQKKTNNAALSSELVSTLRGVIAASEFQDSRVAASLTGGRDSRLVAAIVSQLYCDVYFRTSVSLNTLNSLRDLDVAKKVARSLGKALDVYRFKPGKDENKYRELTDGLSPLYNHSITPLIDNAGAYSVGFGGLYGTELFTPIPWKSIDEYIRVKIEAAKGVLKVENGFWTSFQESLYEEFRRTKDIYQLSYSCEQDYIRLFTLLVMARYSSPIVTAFNREGCQIEPYGSYRIFALAFQVAPSLWGNHRLLEGDALVQKAAMEMVNPQVGRIITYSSFRPMLPLSASSAPFYLIGFIQQITDWIRRGFIELRKKPFRTKLPFGYYLSDGWEKMFLDRTLEQYGYHPKSEKIYSLNGRP
jgi:hypothetical protein